VVKGGQTQVFIFVGSGGAHGTRAWVGVTQLVGRPERPERFCVASRASILGSLFLQKEPFRSGAFRPLFLEVITVNAGWYAPHVKLRSSTATTTRCRRCPRGSGTGRFGRRKRFTHT
jgi:hypothetical protein